MAAVTPVPQEVTRGDFQSNPASVNAALIASASLKLQSWKAHASDVESWGNIHRHEAADVTLPPILEKLSKRHIEAARNVSSTKVGTWFWRASLKPARVSGINNRFLATLNIVEHV